ncbi:hypothetical protein KP509_37G069400 [Ceratopteris richardii]|uniref:PPM-type phosphatase domain-containing protein n=1 Tax=Ceratopteris richardii TaxID=49495 RepID=A0A8T2Q9Y2_CERRI|nr:hypothetical protein KP509_37G069400 [Ceratopteris richardii]
MGSGFSRSMAGCFVASSMHSVKTHSNVLFSEPYDGGLGHSFCYVRPSPDSSPQTINSIHPIDRSKCCHNSGNSDDRRFAVTSICHSHLGLAKSIPETTFKAISGASVSANASTPCTIVFHEQSPTFAMAADERAAAFESTSSFTSLPLQPIPKGVDPCSAALLGGPVSVPSDVALLLSGDFDRGYMSGILERGFLSGPLERSYLSGPIDSGFDPSHFSAPLPTSDMNYSGYKRRVSGMMNVVGKPVRNLWNGASSRMKSLHSQMTEERAKTLNDVPSRVSASSPKDGDDRHLEWAHGKAGEDRVHVVLCDEHGWLFVGIYDGFNGPDAPDFLMKNLYANMYKELRGLLWDADESSRSARGQLNGNNNLNLTGSSIASKLHIRESRGPIGAHTAHSPNKMPKQRKLAARTRRNMSFPSDHRHSVNKENYTTFCDRLNPPHGESDHRAFRTSKRRGTDHSAILEALEHALILTENAYFDMADRCLKENPELGLMGSCVLVMLMKDEDVYVMNVGDSRAILGQYRKLARLHSHCFSHDDLDACCNNSNCTGSKICTDLERIVEESPATELMDYDASFLRSTSPSANLTLTALQLSRDHCMSVEEEVCRIKAAHPDSDLFINDRVKGTLKVTRAFGAGFLKKPRWNSAVLEMFRINYEGTEPYISCLPSLRHHRLGPNDRFLILSSDGLYQYLTNEEAVAHVEWFMDMFPDGDPAQHLIEELLFRAAKKAGMNFHQLLDVPQGDRRKYHDDVSVLVISLTGRIWRSSS